MASNKERPPNASYTRAKHSRFSFRASGRISAALTAPSATARKCRAARAVASHGGILRNNVGNLGAFANTLPRGIRKTDANNRQCGRVPKVPSFEEIGL